MRLGKGESTLGSECSEAIENKGRSCKKCVYKCYRKGMTSSEATRDNKRSVELRRNENGAK